MVLKYIVTDWITPVRCSLDGRYGLGTRAESLFYPFLCQWNPFPLQHRRRLLKDVTSLGFGRTIRFRQMLTLESDLFLLIAFVGNFPDYFVASLNNR